MERGVRMMDFHRVIIMGSGVYNLILLMITRQVRLSEPLPEAGHKKIWVKKRKKKIRLMTFQKYIDHLGSVWYCCCFFAFLPLDVKYKSRLMFGDSIGTKFLAVLAFILTFFGSNKLFTAKSSEGSITI